MLPSTTLVNMNLEGTTNTLMASLIVHVITMKITFSNVILDALSKSDTKKKKLYWIFQNIQSGCHFEVIASFLTAVLDVEYAS